MIGAIVVGLLVSALAAGAIVIGRAWSGSRRGHTRDVPPLVVMPRVVIDVEPASLSATPGVHGAPALSIVGERVAFDDSRFAAPGDTSARSATSETVRFLRPGEEDPIQILPGRLEVVAGESKHREIRFVRSPGEPPELILGREQGRSPQTIALHSDTVSRRHARFAYANGRWAVTNLSRTNPVVVNDERMVDSSSERTLADGDRVELGEVVLRFRSR
jgi:hypothetical protein